MNKKKVLLSLFDGMSCAQLAMKKANVEYDLCYASEIDKPAIKVSSTKFPDMVHLGSVTMFRLYFCSTQRNRDMMLANTTTSKRTRELIVRCNELYEYGVTYLMAGSPCQGFSFAGKGLNFNDPRSALFFDFVKILNACRKINPKVIFLLENVRMKKEHEDVISRILEIQPILINSSLLSAQNRERNYWTNIAMSKKGLFGDNYCAIPQPKDKGILLRDILQPESEVDEKYYLSDKMLTYLNTRKANFNNGKINYKYGEEKASCINASSGHLDISDISDNIIVINRQGEVKPNQNKAGCFTAGGNSGGNHSDMDLICVGERRVIQLNDNDEFGGVPRQQNRIYDTNGLAPTMSIGGGGASATNILLGARIRRLTPIETARLQTVQDDYFFTDGKQIVSDTQIYRMIGNGWTIYVIAYILSFIQ